ncbi:MAG: DsbA family protein [Leucobacter sp.]
MSETIPEQPQQPGPPPNPHAQQPASRRGGSGRVLAVAAMIAGLLALLTAGVSAFYFSVFLVLGGLLGLVAIVLAIIAIVLRQQRAPWIIGLAAGALAIVIAVAAGGLALGALLTPDGAATASASSDSPGATGGDNTDGSPTAWPQNMATGGIVFTSGDKDGKDGIEVLRSEALPAGSALPADPGTGDRIVIYLDYRCPYCSAFEQQNKELLRSVVESGAADVEIRPLTFLDRVDAGGGYSSRTAGAMACLAEAQPEAAWDANQALLDPEFQPAEGVSGPDDGAIIERLDDVSGGLNAEARSCIEKQHFVPFAQFRDAWTTTHTIPDAKGEGVSVTGTPSVMVNGVPYPGSPEDGDAFAAFVKQQGIDPAARTE